MLFKDSGSKALFGWAALGGCRPHDQSLDLREAALKGSGLLIYVKRAISARRTLASKYPTKEKRRNSKPQTAEESKRVPDRDV